jgi:protocatechuate 3,4-dioxygenase beta subunit
VQVRVVDEQNRPVAGAEIYVVQTLMPTQRQEDMTFAGAGPVTADADGAAKIAGLPASTPDQMGWQQTFFARVPGKKAGSGRRIFVRNAPPGMPPLTDVVTIHLVDSSPVSGHATLPEGIPPVGVRANLLYFILNSSAGSSRTAGGMDLFEAKDSQFISQWPQLFSAPLDAQGNFTLNDIPNQCRGGIAIEGAGIGQAQVALLRPDERPIEVRLEKEAIVSGTLRFADGSPAGGATVLLNPDEVVNIVHRGAHVARTDSAGRFRFDGLGQGVYSALVSPSNLDGWVAMPREGIRVTAGETRGEVEISLEHGTVISGQTVSSQGGQPVADVSITALSVGNVNGHAFASGTSGADGKYSIRLPVGQSKLYVSNPGAGFNPPRNQGQRTITISAAGTVEGDLTFAMIPAAPPRGASGFAMIRGQVVDGEGKPLPRIKIGDSRTEDWNGQKMPVSDENAATSDEQGNFQVRVEAGIPHELYIVTPDYTGRSSSITPRASATESIKITATPRPVLGTISGIVVDPQGKPIMNAVVNGMRTSDPDSASSDAQGRFEVPIRRADVMMLISKSGYEMRNWNDIPVDSKDLTFILYPSTRTTMNMGKNPLPDSKALVGKPVPELDVETWAILPGNVPPSLNSGKKTLLLLCENDGKVPARIEQLQQAAAKADAQAIAVFSTYLHEASVKAILKNVKVTCAVAVDRFVPENDYRVNGAMRIALGAERMNRFYLIGADGNVITDNFDPAIGK